LLSGDFKRFLLHFRYSLHAFHIHARQALAQYDGRQSRLKFG
jgi:hypothetical protein